MSFTEFRCMLPSEDRDDEEYGTCQYPKCWMDNCPHWQARDKLEKTQDIMRRVPIRKNFKNHSSWSLSTVEWEMGLEMALGDE